MSKEKTRAPRNQTLTLTDEERKELALNLFVPVKTKKLEINDILNKTVLSDLFEILDFLPGNFADLIIIDPPYNLSRDFHGFKFKATNNSSNLSSATIQRG